MRNFFQPLHRLIKASQLFIFLIIILSIFLPQLSAIQREDLPLAKRIQEEQTWRKEGLILIPHRFNYFLPFTYNTSPHIEAFDLPVRNDVDKKEAKFQISFKILLLENIMNRPAHLYFGYTQLNLWQIYNRSYSAPFRDVNYQPEIFLMNDMSNDILGLTLRRIDYGIVHESNGRSNLLSRSWNRAYANFLFERNYFILALKPWFRLPESKHDDDNPDINRYLGYGEYSLFFVRKNHVLAVTLRNNFRTRGNKGSIEANYTFPLSRTFSGLVQYYNGYGESLLDYNHPNNRIGIGIALSELN